VAAIEVGVLVALGFGLGELRARVGTQIDLALAALLAATLFGPLLIRLRRTRAHAEMPAAKMPRPGDFR
jgi:hypothetical protein